MKSLYLREARLFIVVLSLLFMPVMAQAQSDDPQGDSPPIAQQLTREGDFAVKLLSVLGLGTDEDEIVAENRLSDVGITPRNGWIADYPVTPDIIAELQKSVGDAAKAGKLSISRYEALDRFQKVTAELNMSIRPYASNQGNQQGPSSPREYPEQTEMENYYNEEGPPIVTYYAPPPDYFYLYSWVPFPFFWVDFWFPGFFILRDFHRVEFVGHRAVFISNHFNDFREHRVFRVDPVSRYHGRTYAGIGASHASHKGSFLSTGVPRSDRTIFNGSATRMPRSGSNLGFSHSSGAGGRSSGHGVRSFIRRRH